MKIQESGEMYLESIYLLTKQKGNVRSIDVAQLTGYSKPSVSRAVGLLKKAGYIKVSEEGFLNLTKEGLLIAEQMYERHTLLTTLFHKLGIPDEIASEDACKIEHVISETTFLALKRHAEDFLNKSQGKE